MDRSAVALLFGGRSSEHSISCATAGGVLSAIDRDRYRVIPIGITRDGAFILEDDDPDTFALDPAAMPEVVDNGTRMLWPECGGDARADACGCRRARLDSLGEVDVVFPILHGAVRRGRHSAGATRARRTPVRRQRRARFGALHGQALHEDRARGRGRAVAPWVTVTPARVGCRSDRMGPTAAIARAARVRQARARRFERRCHESVVVWTSLDAALAVAFAEDDKVLIESADRRPRGRVRGAAGRGGARDARERRAARSCSRPASSTTSRPSTSAPTASSWCARPIAQRRRSSPRCSDSRVRAFDAIGGAGLARVDFFFTADEFIVNELNTMPGFTPISMFPKCWHRVGDHLHRAHRRAHPVGARDGSVTRLTQPRNARSPRREADRRRARGPRGPRIRTPCRHRRSPRPRELDRRS